MFDEPILWPATVLGIRDDGRADVRLDAMPMSDGPIRETARATGIDVSQLRAGMRVLCDIEGGFDFTPYRLRIVRLA